MDKIILEKTSGQKFMWYQENIPTYEVLMSYVPKFFENIYEIKKIYEAQGKMIDNAQAAFEVALNNMFIPTMDERNVEALENFLSIVAKSDASLDDRKLELLNHFRGYGKISADVIKETSKNYNLDASVNFDEQDEQDNFILRIKLQVPNNSTSISDYVGNIKTLDIRLPAHLKKLYTICFSTSSKIGLAEISVLKLHFFHECKEVTLEDVPDVLIDDASNILLDDYGNVLIVE